MPNQWECPTCQEVTNAWVCRVYVGSEDKYYARHHCQTCGNDDDVEETVDLV